MSNSTHAEESGESGSRRKRRKISNVWSSFDIVPATATEDTPLQAKCKLCLKNFNYNPSSGTTNLTRHLTIKHDEGDSSPSRLVDPMMYSERCVSAIVEHGYPFSFVEHEGNRDLHAFLNKSVKFVSRNTARADVVKYYEKEKQILKKELDSVNGKICLTSDLWESDTSDGYMDITAHYVDEKWELQNRLLIFRHVPPPHNGVVLAERMFEFLKEWGIESRIFTITLDNASYNDRMIRSLKNYFSFDGSSVCGNEFLHIRCGAHVLNLIVQSGLDVIPHPIYKIRETVKYLRYSEVRKRRFATYVRQLSLPTNKKLRQDLATRWNSTFLMLERAIVFKDVLLRLKDHDEGYVNCPTVDEWQLVEKIAAFLKPFYDLTVLFSTRRYPTANLYFSNVWKIQLFLEKSISSGEDDLIGVMASNMRVKFLKYWECYSMILSFAIVLDPRYKLQFVDYCFNTLDPTTSERKVEEVKTKLTVLFDEYSRISSSQPSEAANTFAGESSSTDVMDAFDSYSSQYGNSVGKSELETYLGEKLVDRKLNPHLDVLGYWKDAAVRYPQLSLVAKDISSIPITSVASESSFSHGGRILGTYRTSLLPENLEAIVCYRDWLSAKRAALDDEIGRAALEEEENALGVDIGHFTSEHDSSSNV